jgi:hypothetical protein
MLLENLGRRDPLVADIYVGGLLAFADETNPYRFQLAAHAFRELIAHCLTMTGEKVVFGDGMPQCLVPVKNAFFALKKTGQLTPDLTSRLSGVSATLIGALSDFFDWSDSNRAENRKKTALMLTQLAGPAPALPSDARRSTSRSLRQPDRESRRSKSRRAQPAYLTCWASGQSSSAQATPRLWQ